MQILLFSFVWLKLFYTISQLDFHGLRGCVCKSGPVIFQRGTDFLNFLHVKSTLYVSNEIEKIVSISNKTIFLDALEVDYSVFAFFA